MKNAFRIFFGADGANSWLVLFCLILASTLELFSLGIFLPLISQWAGQDLASTSALSQMMASLLQKLYVPLDPPFLILLVVFGFMLKFAISFVALSYAGISRAKVATNLRKRSIASLFNARWDFLLAQRSGALANVVGGQANQAGHAYSASADYIAALFQVSVYLLAGILISVWLAVISVVLGLIATFVLKKLIVQSRHAGEEHTKAMSSLVAQVSDLLSNLKPIKAMNRQNELVAIAETQIDRLYNAMCRQSISKYGMRRGADIILTASLGIGLLVAIVYLKLDVSEVMVLGLVALRGADTFQQLQGYLQALNEFESAYWNSYKLIDDFNEKAENKAGQSIETISHGIRFEKVSFSHGTKQILRDVSFNLPKGSLSVFIGPSGTGKTTLIDILLGLYLPDQGGVFIDDISLKDISLPIWRQHIGYVPQDLILLHGTIRENITLANTQFDDADIWRALELARAAEFVHELDCQLDTIVGEFGSKLSGGQRQRIGLARALICNPKLLILDEVTSALDPETERKICNNVAGLKQRYTIIAVTHSPVWISIADQTFSVDCGRIVKTEKMKAP